MNAILTWLALGAVGGLLCVVVWSAIRTRNTARLTFSGLSPAPDADGYLWVVPGDTITGTVNLTAKRTVTLDRVTVAIRLNTHERPEHATSDELGRTEMQIAEATRVVADTKLDLPFSIPFPTQRPTGGLAPGADGTLPGLRPRGKPRPGPGDMERHIYWTLEARADIGDAIPTVSVDIAPTADPERPSA